jgi:hypothetical protein
MDIRYNISELFQKAFGIDIPIYIIPPVTVNWEKEEIPYSGFIMKTEEEAKTISYLGTPIVAPTTLMAGTYMKYKQNGEIIKTTTSDFMLPAVTLIDFRRAKNITKTDMLGSDGTVKEIYGFDDWAINMRGLALGEPGYTAQKQIERLLEYENLADSIDVEGILFSAKGIRRIAIEDIELGQLEGQPQTIPFTIRACSDNPIELVLTEKSLTQ